MILMHRTVAERYLNIAGLQVDHRDRNGLNNQRHNLRPATTSRNSANKPGNRNNTSGFKGVFWDKSKRLWLASIRVNYKQLHLKRWPTQLEAARAYNAAAIKYFGEFAWLNRIEDRRKQVTSVKLERRLAQRRAA